METAWHQKLSEDSLVLEAKSATNLTDAGHVAGYISLTFCISIARKPTYLGRPFSCAISIRTLTVRGKTKELSTRHVFFVEWWKRYLQWGQARRWNSFRVTLGEDKPRARWQCPHCFLRRNPAHGIMTDLIASAVSSLSAETFLKMHGTKLRKLDERKRKGILLARG